MQNQGRCPTCYSGLEASSASAPAWFLTISGIGLGGCLAALEETGIGPHSAARGFARQSFYLQDGFISIKCF